MINFCKNYEKSKKYFDEMKISVNTFITNYEIFPDWLYAIRRSCIVFSEQLFGGNDKFKPFIKTMKYFMIGSLLLENDRNSSYRVFRIDF